MYSGVARHARHPCSFLVSNRAVESDVCFHQLAAGEHVVDDRPERFP